MINVCSSMNRTTIMLPSDLKARAQQKARAEGMSLGEFIRESLINQLAADESEGAGGDLLFTDDAVFDGDAPADFAQNHDDYLYGDRR